MSKRRSVHALLSILFSAIAVQTANAVTLARPPEMLSIRQVGATIELLWAPGGDADGTLHEDVDSYTLQRQIGTGGWTSISVDDEDTGDGVLQMTYVDDVDGLFSWGVGPTFNYRVIATTEDTVTTTSNVVAISLARLRVDEAQDGKARLAWIPSETPGGYPVHLGYIPQKKGPGFNNWIDLETTPISDLSYIHAATTTGASQYRVRTIYQQSPPGTGTTSFNTNSKAVTIHATCEGQAANPYPLSVIDVIDGDEDGPDGDDIAAALADCVDEEYEDLAGPGDNDGIYEPGNGENPIEGGCIVRADAVSYDDVAIMITSNDGMCDQSTDVSQPLHCLTYDFPAGLVIEGQGPETVFRSPLREPPYLPAAILELEKRTFRLTLRNLVLDGRKHESVDPEFRSAPAWHHYGLRVWNTHGGISEITGDGIGTDEDPSETQIAGCQYEACEVMALFDIDGDGRCDPDDDADGSCLEIVGDGVGDEDYICETDQWKEAVGCQSTLDNDNGCVHNVEFRNMLGTGMYISNANNWIVEDSEFHDMGCANRGYGLDCPEFGGAPDHPQIPGYKTDGYGLDVGPYTSNFEVVRNHFYRSLKYGLSFKNGTAVTCEGLNYDHEAAENVLEDIGGVGIFNFGSRRTRIHDNEIIGIRSFGEPYSLNPALNTFGMSLGGYCTDDNEFSDNVLVDAAGLGIMWAGDTEMLACDGDCEAVASVGNRIEGNEIDGTCVEKDAEPDAYANPTPYLFGSIHIHGGSAGDLYLAENTSVNSECRHAISAFSNSPTVNPLVIDVSGGSYASGGDNSALPTVEEAGIFQLACGAVQSHGANLRMVLHDDTSIPNPSTKEVPEACVDLGATLVIDDDGGDPFTDGPYSPAASPYGTPGTIIYCSSDPSC